MDELRTEIRAAFEREQMAHPPVAGLRDDIVAAVSARPRRAPNLQWLAAAAALILAALVVIGLMSTRFHPQASVPAATPQASPSTSPSSAPAPSPAPMTVAAATALIRATVTGANPLLLPSTIPADWSAVVTNLSPSSFTVTYTSPDRSKEVDFAIVVPNPPPPGSNGSQSNPRFHGDSNSLYQVDDTTQPAGPRFLIWNEAGTWSEPNGLPGVPYMLSTTGLTEAEFWATANALVK